MNEEVYVLFGAGIVGRYGLKCAMRDGKAVVCFADNDNQKQGTHIDGVAIFSPSRGRELFPDATWCATVLDHRIAPEIRREMKGMGVRAVPIWEILPDCLGVPSPETIRMLHEIAGDKRTHLLLHDQVEFRSRPDLDRQMGPDSMDELYFPPFIKRLEGEVFVDCGACDGDTIRLFMSKWEKWKHITAFEPDVENLMTLRGSYIGHPNININHAAVGEGSGLIGFEAAGDYTSHVDVRSEASVTCVRLDDAYFRSRPTFIKMDIEGFEEEAIWGARRLIKEHSPVLAICAYHNSDQIWRVPLLVKAINPDYQCLLRRYAEATYEIVWYFVPKARVIG